MNASGGLKAVLVAGGGITGWCAAAALKRRAPFLDVTVLATPPAPAALADRVTCALPSLPAFHADLGLRDEDAVVRAGSGYRLGTLFTGWAEGLAPYVHAYGRYGRPFGTTSFHLQWVRAALDGGAEAFDSFAPAAALARAGRFQPAAPGTPFADHEYGLTLDLPRYRTMIRAFALHLGVREVAGAVSGARLSAGGTIAAAVLADGRELGADLFVDAAGPEAPLRSALDGRRDDWSRAVPCDRVLLAEVAGDAEPPVLTPVRAHAAGWRWSAGRQAGLAYCAAFMTDERAARLLRGAGGGNGGELVRLSPGTRPEPWLGNVVAIGDAATQVEPLEWCNLHLALSAIDRLVTMLPGREPAPVEAADFNRQALAEAERVRDFLAAHYRTARRADPMWRAVAEAEPPIGLAHTLAQFASRGRLPFYEEETFARDSWLAVLLGQGFLPRRVDPLAEAVAPGEARAAMAQMVAGIAAAVPRAPTHAAYLAAQASNVRA